MIPKGKENCRSESVAREPCRRRIRYQAQGAEASVLRPSPQIGHEGRNDFREARPKAVRAAQIPAPSIASFR